MNVLQKLINFPHTLIIRFSPVLNRYLFKTKRVRIGRNFNVIGDVTIDNRGDISIGDDFSMTSGCAMNPISSNLKGYFYCSKTGHIKIGNKVGMSSTRLWIEKGLVVGDGVNIGANALIIDSDCHQIDYRFRCNMVDLLNSTSCLGKNAVVQNSPIELGEYCWIGAETIILKGVTIGARSVIGAGSVVTSDIPADCIAVGNPCKVISYLK